MSTAATETRTYRGKALEELLPLIRAELGEDAVVLERREALSGGFAGFFKRRHIEVVAAVAPRPVLLEDQASALDPAPHDPSGGLSDELAAQINAEILAAEDDDENGEETAGPEPEEPADPEPEETADPEPEAAEGLVVAPIPTLPASFSPRPAPRAFTRSLTPGPVGASLPTVEAQAMLAQLTARGLSESFARDAIEHVLHHLAPVAGPGADLRDLLRAALAARIPIFVPHPGARGRVVGVVGAAGSGKTALVARLAEAYAAGQDRPVACVALRPEDEGHALTRRLRPAGVELWVEADVEAAAERVDGLRGEGIVLLDTPGASPRDETGLRDLASDLDRIDVDERHLVVPATLGASSGRELVAGARALGAEAIAVTHLDETRQLGTVVELAAKTELPISVVSRGVALRPAIADELARELVNL